MAEHQSARRIFPTQGGLRATILLVAALCVAPLPAFAQAWPSKSVTIVAPYPAGGITDLLARIVGEEFAKALGQPFVVENRTGASGAVAHTYVQKAAPDGYTLIMGGSAPTAVTPALNRSLTYGPKDFDPIGYVAELPMVLSTHPSAPGASGADFLAWVKANPGKLNCGHHGTGSGNQFACLKLARMTGTPIADIGYKGAPPVNADLIANRVQIYFGTLPTQLPFAKQGQVKIYGIASPDRVASVPDIPTLEEIGLRGLDLTSWNALYAPAGTPKPVIQRLSQELLRILASPEVRKRIENTGSVVRPGSPEALGKLTMEEFDTYRKLGAESGIRIE